MSSASAPMTKSQRIGLIIFAIAIILTGAMFYMGANGIPLPRWVLALTAIF